LTVVKVSSDGFITMPLIGKIQVTGLTPYQLKKTIEDKLSDGYLISPDVQIFLQQYRERVVHVFGQVGTPGPYRLTHQDTLLEIISKAGGFTPIAKRNKVKIIRKESGQSKTMYIDTTRITDKGNLQEDVPLQPGDIIIVPERFF
jgi:polysaccharide export outer membrane protein